MEKEHHFELLEKAKKEAWSIENMEAHGAYGRSVEYIDSEVIGNTVYDYYRDNTGAFWHRSRVLLETGEVISMEEYIFGRKLPKKYKKKAKK